MTRAYISIGSNIDPAVNVRAAVRALATEVRLLELSTIYRTEPEHGLVQPPFYNGVVLVETSHPPETLKFQVLRSIEARLGRRRTDDRNAARCIDLDVLLYGDLILHTSGMILPDPGIASRPVLAIPLSELAPHLVPPGMTATVSALAAAMPQTSMFPLYSYTAQLRQLAGLSPAAQSCLSEKP